MTNAWHLYSLMCTRTLLTQHSHQDFVDPGEDPDDVERREGDVQEEPHPDLDSLLIADVPVETKTTQCGQHDDSHVYREINITIKTELSRF